MHEFNSPMTVAQSIRLSWISVFRPSVILRLLIPLIFALVLSIALVFWIFPLISTDFVPYLRTFGFIQATIVRLETWVDFSFLFWLSFVILMIFIFIFAYFILIISTAIVLVPLLVPIIQNLYFPSLAKSSELSFIGSIMQTLKAIFYYFLFILLLSPFILFVPGIGQFIIPFFLNANLARQVFPYDVLANYATTAEFQRFQRDEKQSLWVVSLLTGGYFYIPVLNLLAAPMTALTFIIFSLGKIQDYRRGRLSH